VAQLVEHHLAKVRVAGSSPVFRSTPFLTTPVDFGSTGAPSSSGRTPDFGSVNRGSNPRGAATHRGRSVLVASGRTWGDVAKRPKATVCKTVIHRFESGRRLHRSTVQPQRAEAVGLAGLPRKVGGGLFYFHQLNQRAPARSTKADYRMALASTVLSFLVVVMSAIALWQAFQP
jgi:hypothetical protein